MSYLTKKQKKERFVAGFWRQMREPAPDTQIYVPVKIEDDCIDNLDRMLNPIGRFFRHNAMHAGTARMVLDKFGRCAHCVKFGLWKPDA